MYMQLMHVCGTHPLPVQLSCKPCRNAANSSYFTFKLFDIRFFVFCVVTATAFAHTDPKILKAQTLYHS